jgi:hypothetical protein
VTARAAAGGLLRLPLAWAFGPGDPRQLAALRIGLGSAVALRFATRADVYLSLADQERELFRPRSYMALMDQMPSRPTIAICLVAAIVAAALAAAGLWSRTMLAIALVAALLLNGMQTSQGKVLHNDVLLVLCLIAIVFARHGDAWSLDRWLMRRRDRGGGVAAPHVGAGAAYGWPVRIAMLVIALAYLIAGLHKVAGSGGLGWASSDNLRWLLYVASDAQGHNTVALWIAEHPWIAHLAAYGLLATECLFFLVLLAPRLRWVFVPAVIALHIGTWVTLGLDYSAWVLCVVVVFVTWPAVVARISGAAGGPTRAVLARAASRVSPPR